MKAAHSILISALLLFVACAKKDPAIPAEMIPRDSMVQILADIHIAEARLIQDGYKPNNQAYKAEYIQHVLSKSNVDSTRFNESFLFYSSAPDFFQHMYDDVIIEISKKQAGVKSN